MMPQAMLAKIPAISALRINSNCNASIMVAPRCHVQGRRDAERRGRLGQWDIGTLISAYPA
jgi:hypothetical protein